MIDLSLYLNTVIPVNEAKIVQLIGGKDSANYGNVVIMGGGAASGKGFVQRFIDANFKIFDVDELKKQYARLFPEKEDGTKWNFKNPDDVFNLHMEVKKKGWSDKQKQELVQSIGGNKSGILPNLLFDITAKDKTDIDDIIYLTKGLGYKINFVYVVQSLEAAKVNNRLRSRSVPVDVLINTHNKSYNNIPAYLKSNNELDAAWIYLAYDPRYYDVTAEEKQNCAYKLPKTDKGGFAISSDLAKKMNELRTRKIDVDRLERVIYDAEKGIRDKMALGAKEEDLDLTLNDLKEIYNDLRKK